jgi:hypothetical protein
MKNQVGGFLIAFALALPAGAKEYVHPKIKSKEKTVRTAAVLPARVEFQKSGLKGAEGMIRESDVVAEGLTKAVINALSRRGVTAQAAPAVSPAADSEQRYGVADLQSRFDTLLPQLLRSSKDVTKGRFSLGDEVGGTAIESADALVFIRAQGIQQTKARAFVFGGLAGMMARTSIQCQISVVDAKTGEVLFLSKQAYLGGMDSIGSAMQKRLAKEFQKLHAAQN